MAKENRRSTRASGRLVLRLIAVEKLAKAVLLLVLGVGTFRVVHRDLQQVAVQLVHAIHLDANNHIVHQALARLVGIDAHRLRQIGVGFFVYATLFLVEAYGLWLDRRWAEYLTVISTTLLIPIEIFETIRRFTATRIIVLVVNAAIVIYLVARLRENRAARRSAARPPEHGLDAK